MHLAKLTTLLKSLTKSELKQLRLYVYSPYFKTPVAAVALFDYIENLHPNFDAPKIEPKIIAKKEKRLPTENKQAKAGTQLLKAAEEFLAFENFRSKNYEVIFNRLEAFKNHHLFDSFTKEYLQLTEQHTKTEPANFDAFYQKHLHTELGFNNFNALLNRKGQNNIYPVIKTLDEFYAIKKLRYLCEAVHRHNLLNHPLPVVNSTPLLKILEPYNNPNCLYVYLFALVYQIFTATTYKKSLPAYHQIKKQVEAKSSQKLSPEIIEVITYAASHCQRWANKGIAQAGKEQLWWFEFRKQQDLLLINGKILPTTFCNMAVLYKQFGTPVQIKNFIAAYSGYLPAPSSQVYLAFAQGIYYYATQKYDEAAAQFLKAQANIDPVFNCMLKRWFFMACYDMRPNNTDGLQTTIASYEKYVQRHKEQLHTLMPAFIGFIAYAKKLVASPLKDERQTLLKELETEKFFFGKDWLAQKYATGLTKAKPVAF